MPDSHWLYTSNASGWNTILLVLGLDDGEHHAIYRRPAEPRPLRHRTLHACADVQSDRRHLRLTRRRVPGRQIPGDIL